MSSPQTRILCVDDHAFLVEGLKAQFALETDMKVVGRLSSAERLVEEATRLRPDVILLDIEMPGPDPFEAADQVRRLVHGARVVFLSAYVRDHYISAAFKAGAWGYFSKADDTAAIVEGIRKVARGEFALGPKVQERCRPVAEPGGLRAGGRGAHPGVAPPASRLDVLTAREREVLRLIGKGLTRNQIAEALFRSAKTIDGHQERIMKKLDIDSRAELVRFAIREGVVEA